VARHRILFERLQQNLTLARRPRIERMSRRDDELRSKIQKFAQQYARKAQRGADPNDRHYDREIERLVQRMSPEELDAYLNEGNALDDE
jgi:hypothetical protein